MVLSRAVKAGVALIGWLALPSLLPAQVTTPHITSLQSGPSPSCGVGTAHKWSRNYRGDADAK